MLEKSLICRGQVYANIVNYLGYHEIFGKMSYRLISSPPSSTDQLMVLDFKQDWIHTSIFSACLVICVVGLVDGTLPACKDNIKFCWSIQWAGSICYLYWERKSKGPLWKVNVVSQCCLEEEEDEENTVLKTLGSQIIRKNKEKLDGESSETWLYYMQNVGHNEEEGRHLLA